METIMTQALRTLSRIKRPKLLLAAARNAKNLCNREKLLSELLKNEPAVTGEKALARLMAAEEQLNEQRKAHNANYQPSRHVMIMAALLIEAAIVQNKETVCADRLKLVNPKAYINASGMDAFFSAT